VIKKKSKKVNGLNPGVSIVCLRLIVQVRVVLKRTAVKLITCSRLSDSEGNRKSERVTNGIRSEQNLGEKRRGPDLFPI